MKKIIFSIALSGLLFACSSNKTISNSTETDLTETKEVVVTSYGPKGKIIKSVKTKEVPLREIVSLEKAESKKALKLKDNKEPKEPSNNNVGFYASMDVIDNQKKSFSKQGVGLSSNNSYDSWMNFIKEKSVVYRSLSAMQENATPKNGSGDTKKNWASIAGFSVSIVGLIIFGFIFGTVAIIFGAIGLKSDMRGLAIAALVIGIVDVIAAIIIAAAAA